MAWGIVIAGGGFGGLDAARPLVRVLARRAELGQLGHPPALGSESLSGKSAGGTR
jgi:hypothetical protein